jgi:hypothetical protein
MSATTWPEPETELVCAWQPDWPLAQLALVVDVPSGGPRAPPAPFSAAGASLPEVEVRVVPVQTMLPRQSRVALAIVQLDAPGTVGPPEFALDPGAVGAGGVAGWSVPGSPGCCRGAWSPVVPDVTVAFFVERACTSGAMLFASGPDDAAELLTAWHTAPETPAQEASECEPRASGETVGSVAVAALVAVPVHTGWPAQVSVAPAADAADGPATNRAALNVCVVPACDCAASACAAPGPVDAVETDRTSQALVPPVHDAVAFDDRGVPPATAPSHAVVLV